MLLWFYILAWHGAVWCSVVWCVVQCHGAVWCSMVQCGVSCVVQCHGVVWCVVQCHGAVWCSMHVHVDRITPCIHAAIQYLIGCTKILIGAISQTLELCMA